MDQLAFVFPGQGSQKLNMLSDFETTEVFQRTYAEAKAALGFDLLDMIKTDEVRLNQTQYTQPAILAGSIALWRLFCENSPARPHYVAGHSLGEYSALVAAEVLSLEEALRLVHLRGTLMQEAVKPGEGAMAAILGLEDEDVISACTKAAQNEIVAAVNFNSPGQVVIAGQAAAVQRAIEAAKAKGAKKAILLPVSVPSHCLLMKPAAEALAKALDKVQFQKPKYAIIQNVDADFHDDPEAIKAHLIQQLYEPVRWAQSIEKLFQKTVTIYIECGPGKVLSNLTKRILNTPQLYALEDQQGFDAACAALNK